jgi:hypothetical protein
MALAAGNKLGPYEIVAPIGRTGLACTMRRAPGLRANNPLFIGFLPC